jgi:endonuclease YncB( thermonuclease family)
MRHGLEKWNGQTVNNRSRATPTSKLLITTVLFLGFGLASASAPVFQILSIHDGDTLTILSGEKVRVLQIDTPEISPAECYGAEARKALVDIIGKSPITLESDSVLDDIDSRGRILRYVKIGKLNVNLKLVEIGAATPYFFKGEKGKYSAQLLMAAQNAKAKKIGLWKLCPNTKLDASKPADTGPVPSKLTSSPKANSNCDPNYQGCIPPYPPDLNCEDIKKMKLAPIRVIGVDVHKFDRDGDGIGCDK